MTTILELTRGLEFSIRGMSKGMACGTWFLWFCLPMVILLDTKFVVKAELVGGKGATLVVDDGVGLVRRVR